LGDLVSGQEMDVVLHMYFPLGRVGERVDARVAVRDRDGVLGGGETVS
jgi:hypothetical protein